MNARELLETLISLMKRYISTHYITVQLTFNPATVSLLLFPPHYVTWCLNPQQVKLCQQSSMFIECCWECFCLCECVGLWRCFAGETVNGWAQDGDIKNVTPTVTLSVVKVCVRVVWLTVVLSRGLPVTVTLMMIFSAKTPVTSPTWTTYPSCSLWPGTQVGNLITIHIL